MYFNTLFLKNFRNFSEFETEFSNSINIFIGRNGQGKTNLLESLYFLTYGSSFRYSSNQTLIKTNEQEAAVRALVKKNDLNHELAASLRENKKSFYLNQKKVMSSNLRTQFSAVLFSPESLSVIKESAEHRRNLIDDLLVSVQPQKIKLLASFKKCLRSRNRILKNFKEGISNRQQTIAVLESYNPPFLSLATELTVARLQALENILPQAQQTMRMLNSSSSFDVDISVEYVVSRENITKWDASNINDLMKKRMQELQSMELASGTSLVGPQKHDVMLLHNQNDSRFYCSQGQQRALILALKMAQIVYHKELHGDYPVLMLDDVLSELDSEKREALISFLKKIDTQIFITATELELSSSLNGKTIAVFDISEGQLKERSLLL